MWSSSTGGCVGVREDVSVPTSLGRLAQPRPERGIGVRLARDPQTLVGDVVEQDHLPDLAAVACGVGLRAPQRALPNWASGQPGGLLLAVEEDEADLAMVLRQVALERPAQARRPPRSRRRRRWRRRSRGWSPRCRSARRPGSRGRAPGSCRRCCGGRRRAARISALGSIAAQLAAEPPRGLGSRRALPEGDLAPRSGRRPRRRRSGPDLRLSRPDPPQPAEDSAAQSSERR